MDGARAGTGERAMSKCIVCGKENVKLWRSYGGFFREDEVWCKAHKPKEWVVPLIKDKGGDVWGYTSVPDDAIEAWKKLPE